MRHLVASLYLISFIHRKRPIFRIKIITANIDRFYAKYGAYNYASKIRISDKNVEVMHFLCKTGSYQLPFRRKT